LLIKLTLFTFASYQLKAAVCKVCLGRYFTLFCGSKKIHFSTCFSYIYYTKNHMKSSIILPKMGALLGDKISGEINMSNQLFMAFFTIAL
jgi:hypothetical protein